MPQKDKNNNILPQIIIAVQPLLVSADIAAGICGISKRFWLQLDNQGRIPRSVMLGKRRLWRISDLQKWAAMGCVSRKEFQDVLL